MEENKRRELKKKVIRIWVKTALAAVDRGAWRQRASALNSALEKEQVITMIVCD